MKKILVISGFSGVGKGTVVEMLMTLEDNFNITVTDEESVALKTVGDIVKLIDSKTTKK